MQVSVRPTDPLPANIVSAPRIRWIDIGRWGISVGLRGVSGDGTPRVLHVALTLDGLALSPWVLEAWQQDADDQRDDRMDEQQLSRENPHGDRVVDRFGIASSRLGYVFCP